MSYSKQPVLGFPGTTPLPEAVDILKLVAGSHPNHIGYHTLNPNKPAEMGFAGTQALERDLVYRVASLLGSKNPELGIDGYVCNGGTDGNMHGLWMGMEKLVRDVPVGRKHNRKGVVILTSCLQHYSVLKWFNFRFGAETRMGVPRKHRSILYELGTNERGEVTAPEVVRAIRLLYRRGYRRFLLALTAGTTNLGSVDQIPEINRALFALRRELGPRRVGFYIHVDAAFGGFILPFLEPGYKFGFQNRLVGSMCVDAHKMGRLPYPTGVFLCRKGWMRRYTSTKAPYLPNHVDYTLIGSRPGASAVATWAATQLLGWDGYKLAAEACMETTRYLKQRLEALNVNGQEVAHLYPSRLNVVAVRFSKKLGRVLKAKRGRRPPLREKYLLPTAKFPRNLTSAKRRGRLIVLNTEVFRFAAMPHVRKEYVDRFIRDLRRAARIR